jgi:deoxycytidylate deaminase
MPESEAPVQVQPESDVPEPKIRRGRLSFENPDAEVVFGLVCAVGVNYRKIETQLANFLRGFGYSPSTIKLSDRVRELAEDLKLTDAPQDQNEYIRIRSLMKAGNEARRKAECGELLALAAISKINSQRKRSIETPIPELLPRAAHIIVTLKRPEEADILRKVYGPAFFLVGVFATERERSSYLQDEFGMSEAEAMTLIKEDEEDQDLLGQRTRKTFHRADVFVALAGNKYKQQLKRFLDLVFRHPYHTPTPDEHGMFIAYAASLRSAQLGRQVGASIVSPHGDLIATGCNEVPKAGGGTYWPGRPDFRDHQRGEDSNDVRKEAIASDILDKLRPMMRDGVDGNARELLKTSILFDITEFGRAVHAEMDAILSCSRTGTSTRDATVYTTTFPCHNCARHIVAAGIKRVVYIEPYPKSMADKLHSDSIRVEGHQIPAGARTGKLIPFEPFVGIGPRRYADLFAMKLSTGFSIKRKSDDGKTIRWTGENGRVRVPVQPVSYLQREQLAAEELEEILAVSNKG